MAWTSPTTWSACSVVTAAQFNVQIRDNFLQTVPALVTTRGDSVFATGANAGARVAVGANNTVIVANSACNAGVQWSSACVLVTSVCSGTLGPTLQIWNQGGGAHDTGAVQFYSGAPTGCSQRAAIQFDVQATGGGAIEFISGSGGAQIEAGRVYDGQLMVGASAYNSKMTFGVVIAASTADEILTLKDSTLAHGMTTLTETTSFGTLSEHTAGTTAGGLEISGFGGTVLTAGLTLTGVGGAASNGFNTGHATTASGIVDIVAGFTNGTGATLASSAYNLMVINNGASARFVFGGGGDLFADSGLSASAWDSHDDVQMVRALEVERAPSSVIRDRFDAWLKYSRKDLEAANIATFNDPAEGGDGSVFVNVTGLQRLQSGAIWQLYKQSELMRQQLEERLARLEQLLIGPPKATT